MRNVLWVMLLCAAVLSLTSCASVRLGGGDGYSKAPFLIGAYYFPGWIETPGAPWNPPWERLIPFPERIPLLGFYKEGSTEVAEQHIRWAAQYGISFFAYDWYWTNNDQPYLEHALRAYLRAKNRDLLKFALLWANHPPSVTTPEGLQRIVRYWVENFFLQPEYLRMDGKPVVIVFSPLTLRKDLGGPSEVLKALEGAQQVARSFGLSGIYFVAAAGPDQIRFLVEEGYDAATGYDYPFAGINEPGVSRGPYSAAIEGYERIWHAYAADGRLTYFVPTLPGRDGRPWYGERAIIRDGSSPEGFKQMLLKARSFVDRHPRLTRKVILVMAWNEFGEGGYIEPTRGWGFGFLEAIREVFGQPAQ